VKFVCPHCAGTAYRFLSGVDGKAAAECLNCGKASALDQSMSSEPASPAEATKPPGAKKRQ